ncbi:MAG: TonB family protein [Myxococcota bacterium]
MLVVAFAVSAAVHVPMGFGLQALIPSLLAKSDRPTPRKPVEVVRLTPDAYESTLAKARRAVPQKTEAQKRREQKKREEEDRREREKKGQVVEVASQNKTPPKNARFLAKENSSVERETVARDRDPDRKGKVTAKLQKADSKAKQGRGIPVPGLRSSGDGGKPGGGAQGQGRQQRRRFQLEMPKLARREAVELDITELPELSAGRILNRERRDAIPGQQRQLDVGRDAQDAEASAPGSKGSGARSGLPRLEDLRPTLGTIARISGSPSDDYVENVPEGEGTFLNAREFKYATFFYQVRDSVAPYWRSDLRSELRRRDPAGNTFGYSNVQTVLFIRLDTSGRLDQVKVQKSSGYQFFDALAVRAFEQAESFPNPPKGMVENGHVDFNFLFVLTPPRRGPLGLFR